MMTSERIAEITAAAHELRAEHTRRIDHASWTNDARRPMAEVEAARRAAHETRDALRSLATASKGYPAFVGL